MNSITPCSRSSIGRSVARIPPYTSVLLLVIASILLASVNVFGTTTNHPPTVSWIKDQANTTGTLFAQVYFRAWDKETTIGLSNLSYAVQNHPDSPNFYTGTIRIDACTASDTGCPQDGTGFKLNFDAVSGDGAATIKITATDGGNPIKTAASSFTLRKQSAAVNPPTIAGIPNEQIQAGTGFGYGPVWFVVDDLDAAGVDDAIGLNGDSTVTASVLSDNTDVVAVADVQLTPPVNGLKWSFKVAPHPNAVPGRAVITITFTDSQLPVHFKTSTSFVLDVIDTTSNAAPPSFTPAPSPSGSYIEHDVTRSQSIVYNFKVTDSQAPKSQLLVTATSSNANLVPNDTAHLTVSSISNIGTGTLTITPVFEGSPSPPTYFRAQAATITLAVTDDAYTRRKQFLYVAKNPTSPSLSFSRPNGVYNLDPKTPADQRPDDAFITGEMHRIGWFELETSDNFFDWDKLDDAVANLPLGQDLSLNLAGEPCYIATLQGVQTWCDTGNPAQQTACGTTCTNGVLRALPWDLTLQGRRARFLLELANHVIPATQRTVAKEPLIRIINLNLPGGDTGIRELNGQPFSDPPLMGYTREALLTAVQTELRAVVQSFSTKLVHIGFFTVEDNLNGQYGGV